MVLRAVDLNDHKYNLLWIIVNTPNHMRDKMAAKYSSDFEIEDKLSQKSVEQLQYMDCLKERDC